MLPQELDSAIADLGAAITDIGSPLYFIQPTNLLSQYLEKVDSARRRFVQLKALVEELNTTSVDRELSACDPGILAFATIPVLHGSQELDLSRAGADRIYRHTLDTFFPLVEDPQDHWAYTNHGVKQDKLHRALKLLRQSIEAILERRLKVKANEKPALDHPARLSFEDIDSFAKVRSILPSEVLPILNNGFLDMLEEDVQKGIEDIIGEAFHKRDSGSETNDLYSSNLLLNGSRVAAAFVLKGRGKRKLVHEISDFGATGNQIIRLTESPAEIFVVQSVAVISESVIKHVEAQVLALRSKGAKAQYCIMNGQDTARLLRAYGKLNGAGPQSAR